ncbi:MAG TPA: microviridin/marinostatin family tricyclic proteinase inhibitor [Chitinophagaceae bacterium]|nr:microviridin/marinostatin family tricyclic proteinase inhibitor [Chitinophagaceae bacterium]
MKQQDQVKQPFFAQFLECQRTEDQNNELTSPLKDPVTQKYPSDGDDNPPEV